MDLAAVRTIIHPKHPALEQIELHLPDQWQVAVDDDPDVSEDVLNLYHETTEDWLFLSLVSHQYVTGLLPPHLVEMAERALAKISDGPISGQRGWRVVPENYKDAPMDHTGAQSPHDVTAGTAAAKTRDGAFIQVFYILQYTSLVLATYWCESADQPGKLEEAKEILRTVKIRRSDAVGTG